MSIQRVDWTAVYLLPTYRALINYSPLSPSINFITLRMNHRPQISSGANKGILKSDHMIWRDFQRSINNITSSSPVLVRLRGEASEDARRILERDLPLHASLRSNAGDTMMADCLKLLDLEDIDIIDGDYALPKSEDDDKRVEIKVLSVSVGLLDPDIITSAWTRASKNGTCNVSFFRHENTRGKLKPRLRSVDRSSSASGGDQAQISQSEPSLKKRRIIFPASALMGVDAFHIVSNKYETADYIDELHHKILARWLANEDILLPLRSHAIQTIEDKQREIEILRQRRTATSRRADLH